MESMTIDHDINDYILIKKHLHNTTQITNSEFIRLMNLIEIKENITIKKILHHNNNDNNDLIFDIIVAFYYKFVEINQKNISPSIYYSVWNFYYKLMGVRIESYFEDLNDQDKIIMLATDKDVYLNALENNIMFIINNYIKIQDILPDLLKYKYDYLTLLVKFTLKKGINIETLLIKIFTKSVFTSHVDILELYLNVNDQLVQLCLETLDENNFCNIFFASVKTNKIKLQNIIMLVCKNKKYIFPNRLYKECDLQKNFNILSPIHYAYYHKNDKMIEFLLEHLETETIEIFNKTKSLSNLILFDISILTIHFNLESQITGRIICHFSVRFFKLKMII